MDLIERYLQNLHTISQLTAADYSGKKKVRKNNKLSTENRQIATDIELHFPELKAPFSALLADENWKVRCQAAHHMLEVMNYPPAERKKALNEIRAVIKMDILVESLGNKMWLQQWYKQHPEDAKL